MAPKPKQSKRYEENFHEFMPGYMDSYSMFPTREAEEEQDLVHEQEEDDAARNTMVRQLAVLVGLLVLQFILFVVLIQSTVNLG